MKRLLDRPDRQDKCPVGFILMIHIPRVQHDRIGPYRSTESTGITSSDG